MLKRTLHITLAVLMGALFGLVSTNTASALEPTVYNQPGDHKENGRYWRTSCEMYSSQVVRCNTEIWATTMVKANGTYYSHNAWVFNNLTYLPSNRAAWAKNPLGKSGNWTASDGRQWMTRCDTSVTGQHGCRSWAKTEVVLKSGGKYVSKNIWVMNNMVKFGHSALPVQTAILPKSASISNMPKDTAFKAPTATKAPAASTSGYGINLARSAMWDRIAKCESTNNWSINTGNGYYGGLQFNLATWRSVRGQDFAAYPHHATRAEQITVANRLFAKRGTQPWSCA